jgi:hypothetical protein
MAFRARRPIAALPPSCPCCSPSTRSESTRSESDADAVAAETDPWRCAPAAVQSIGRVCGRRLLIRPAGGDGRPVRRGLELARAPGHHQRDPALRQEMGTSHFQRNFQDLFFDNQISTVRVIAAEGVAAIVETAGSQWLQADLMPAIKERYEGSEQHLACVSTPRGCKVFGKIGAEFSAQLLNDVTELCVKGLVDTVPNVKFVACPDPHGAVQPVVPRRWHRR